MTLRTGEPDGPFMEDGPSIPAAYRRLPPDCEDPAPRPHIGYGREQWVSGFRAGMMAAVALYALGWASGTAMGWLQ